MAEALAEGGTKSARGGAGPSPGVFEQLGAVADAVLYEGYLLYPYRRSSTKNRVRWQFGVLFPRDWVEADGPVTPGVSGSADSWYQQTECLLRVRQPDSARVRVRVRYLQMQRKQVEEAGRPVESLRGDDGTVHLTFDEALPRECEIEAPLDELLRGGRTVPVSAAAGEDVEPLPDVAGRVVRSREEIRAESTVTAERLSDGLCRIRVRTRNTAPAPAPRTPRDEALRRALIATHTLIGGEGVEFVSLIDPPADLQALVRACRNEFTFPVLGGEAGDTGPVLLSAPIILPDHPQVAPESPGDLHDAAEIDEILTLRTMLLTDEEKREARATDPRAAAILDRVDTMPQEVFERLHGAVRSLTPSTPTPRADGLSGGVGSPDPVASTAAHADGLSGAAGSPEPVASTTASADGLSGAAGSPEPVASATAPADRLPDAVGSPAPVNLASAPADRLPGAAGSPDPVTHATASVDLSPGAAGSPDPVTSAAASADGLPGAAGSPEPVASTTASADGLSGAAGSPEPVASATAPADRLPDAVGSPAPVNLASAPADRLPGAAGSPDPVTHATASVDLSPGAAGSPDPVTSAAASADRLSGAAGSPDPVTSAAAPADRLPGAVGSPDPVTSATASADRPAWWQEGGDDGLAPTTDTVLVGGVPLGGGSRVRLRPRGRGADAQDMFLAGRTAEVAAVFHDVDGSMHLAVTLDDDPAAELNNWYGRFHYFRPDELEPLESAGSPDEPSAPAPAAAPARHTSDSETPAAEAE
ncbi:hypothetical protein AB0D40_14860 [Streptomyces massasporeus]|uniref:hypothetical protein n=1 Tax=Streptomyces massasporeus TaxID=67324 RepID=UPI00340070C3